MKSGPTLNTETVIPFLKRAASIPSVIVVLPEPLFIPAIINPLINLTPYVDYTGNSSIICLIVVDHL